MVVFPLMCVVLFLSQFALAADPTTVIIRSTFSSSTRTADPSLPVYQREVTPREITSWKINLVDQLFNRDVRDALNGDDGGRFLREITNEYKNGVTGGTAPVFMTRLEDFARDRGLDIHLGLLETISLESLKRDRQISAHFVVDFALPRAELKQALKEILYTAGYIDGLEELFSVVIGEEKSPTKRVLLKVWMKHIAADLPKASALLEKGSLQDLENLPEMRFLDNAIEKVLDGHLESWARLFCGLASKS